MNRQSYEERDGQLYIRCYRCGAYIPNDELWRHQRKGCSRGARKEPLAESSTDPSVCQEDRQRSAIRQICEERQISKVVHFTRIENLASILQEGLLSRATLERQNSRTGRSFIAVDPHRYDGRTDTISLSISFPNYQMLYTHRQKTDGKSWVVLSLKASLLWELKCSFFPENAASSKMRKQSLAALRGPKALRDMFTEKLVKDGDVVQRSGLSLPDSYPTDPQAEVLVHEPVSAGFIVDVAFNTYTQRKRWIETYGTDWLEVPLTVKPGFFRSRPGHWPHPSGAEQETD